MSTTSSPTTTIPSGALAAIEAITAEIENNLTPGGLAFNHPDRMAFGETLTIQLKVESGARGVEIAPTNYEEGNVVPADIEVVALMPAILVGRGFDIVPLTPPIQALPGMRSGNGRSPQKTRESKSWP
ncbi:MAG: hypothetical protein O6923_06865 [Actinobacteria bacterium]|nr:hypothetical protein [Actinomycetota bacterium]